MQVLVSLDRRRMISIFPKRAVVVFALIIFLRTAAGLTLGGTLLASSRLVRAATVHKRKKVVVITFGGGARDQETFAAEGQENIPHLMKDLIPQSTFFTQVVNRGILGHYVATASLATGIRYGDALT